MHGMSAVLHDLGRYQEAFEPAAEILRFTKGKYGLDHDYTLQAMERYALTCAKLGRIEESKAIFAEILATETRIFGRDNPMTQMTLYNMDQLVERS